METHSIEQPAQDKRLLLFSPLGSEVQSLLEWKTGLFGWLRHLTIWDVQSQGHVSKSIQDFPVEAMRLFVTWTWDYLSLCYSSVKSIGNVRLQGREMVPRCDWLWGSGVTCETEAISRKSTPQRRARFQPRRERGRIHSHTGEILFRKTPAVYNFIPHNLPIWRVKVIKFK